MDFISFFEAFVTFRESTITSPSVGFTKLLIVLRRVDLPQPLVTTRTVNYWIFTLRDMSLITCTSP